MGRYLEVFKLAYAEWTEDEATRLGAALAFYTALSIAPLLVVLIAVIGMALGEEAARGQVVSEIGGLVGTETAQSIEGAIEHARQPATGTIAAILSLITLILGASGVVAELKSSLNRIWDVKVVDAGGILGIVKQRLFSFAMVLGIGFVLLVSLALSALLAGVGKFFKDFLPLPEPVLHGANLLLSFVVITALFGVIYKYLPDVEVAWSDVLKGAAFTAVLFVIGKFLLGLYLGKAGVGSAYGAAGSLVVLLVWVYYSAQIFFFGAEVTQVYANMYGSRIRAAKGAELIESPPQVKRDGGERYQVQAQTRVQTGEQNRNLPTPVNSSGGALAKPPGKLTAMGGIAIAAGVLGLKFWNRHSRAAGERRHVR